jgi:outer membrane protein TolC
MTRARQWLIAALALTSGLAEAQSGSPVRLSESQVVALAVQQAPSIVASRLDAVAAEAEHTAAQRARLPDLTLAAGYTRVSSVSERLRTVSVPLSGVTVSAVVPNFLNRYEARASLVVPISDAFLGLAASARALGEVARARRLEHVANESRVTYEARAAFLLCRRAHTARRVAAAALEAAVAQKHDQDNRVHSGSAPPSSALTFETARNRAEARLRIAQAEVGAAEAAVRFFLPAELANAELSCEEPSAPLPVGGAGLPASSPQLQAARAAVQAAEARCDAEKLAALPHLAVVLGADVAAPSQRAPIANKLQAVPGWDVGVQLSWSLSDLTVGSARRDRAAAERGALAARAQELERQLQAQHVSASAARESALARVSAAQAAVAATIALVDARQRELSAGFATPLDTTLAQAERVSAELEQADAELELRLAEARLAFVAGYVERSAVALRVP